MRRREAIRGGAALAATLTAGCVLEDANDRAAEEAERSVNETLEEELVRPPNAEVDVRDDGSVIVLSLAPGTVGVKCGLTDGKDPVTAVRESDRAVTTAGTRIEGCEGELLIAVNEAGDVEILAEL